MPYEYLEEGVTADVTFRATGASLDEVFAAAAEATTNVMVEEPGEIGARASRAVEVEAESLDMLLYRFLGEIIFYKDADRLITRAANVRVEETGGGYRLRAELRGESLDPKRHRLAADAKAVTLHGLEVTRTGGGWRATVTLDV
jgi:SHS2 domain-containing protein